MKQIRRWAMSKKSKSAKGDGTIKSINLNRGQYSEKKLVQIICTDAQKREYFKKERFPNKQKHDAFLKRLARYCEFEYISESGKYKIKKVFDTPLSEVEIKLQRGIYKYLAPLILDRVINTKGRSRYSIMSPYEFAKDIFLVNQNYGIAKSNKTTICNDLAMHKYTVDEFFNNTDNRVAYYIEKCLQYLSSLNCLIYSKIFIICNAESETEPYTRHKASKDEVSLYAQLVNIASQNAGIKYEYEKWYGPKATKYKPELDLLLQGNLIKYCITGFELWRIDERRCLDVLSLFKGKLITSIEKEIGVIFKTLIDDNAKNRQNDKPRIDNH